MEIMTLPPKFPLLLYVSDRLACAGQPDETQLAKMADEGFEVVINLGLQNCSTS
jgi:hypothetical protein